MKSVDAHSEILIVEDEALIRMELAMDLGDLGFVVHEADGVSSALSVLDEHPTIAAGVFDIHLGGEATGYDLVQAIRRKRPDFIVMVITGSGFAIPDGFDEHVMIAAKPVDSRKIALAMGAKLGRSPKT